MRQARLSRRRAHSRSRWPMTDRALENPAEEPSQHVAGRCRIHRDELRSAEATGATLRNQTCSAEAVHLARHLGRQVGVLTRRRSEVLGELEGAAGGEDHHVGTREPDRWHHGYRLVHRSVGPGARRPWPLDRSKASPSSVGSRWGTQVTPADPAAHRVTNPGDRSPLRPDVRRRAARMVSGGRAGRHAPRPD